MDGTQRKRVSRIRAVKNIIFLGLITSMIVYQVEWFRSAGNMDVSFDVANYTDVEFDFQPLQPDAFSGYVDTLLSYLQDPGQLAALNVSQIEAFLLNNATLMERLESALNKTITTARQVYDAYLNGTLGELVMEYFHQFWNAALERFLPDAWQEPSRVLIRNGGWAAISDVTLHGQFRFLGRQAPFMNVSQPHLAAGEVLVAELSLAGVIRAIAGIVMDNLVEITLSLLATPPEGQVKVLVEHLFRVVLQSRPVAEVAVAARCGLLPVSAAFSIDVGALLPDGIASWEGSP